MGQELLAAPGTQVALRTFFSVQCPPGLEIPPQYPPCLSLPSLGLSLCMAIFLHLYLFFFF